MLQHEQLDMPGIILEPDLAPAPGPSGENDAPRKSRWRYAVVPTVLGLLAAGGFYVGKSSSHGPTYPKAWDPRIAELASFVAAERGLAFEHPVHVDFLPETDFKETLTADEAKISSEQRKQLKDAEALVRSIGLPLGDTSLFDSTNTLSGESLAAYYSPQTKRITVRGTDLSPARKVFLAHELVHVLQDQHFDLTRLDSFDSDRQKFAFRAVVEGDALRIQAAYLKTLGESERAAADKETATEAEDSTANLADVPHWLTASFGAQYTFGEQFAGSIVAAKGRKALDDALRHPPVSEEQTYEVVRYLKADKPTTVEAPDLRSGDREIARRDFGTLTLMFMLAEHLPPLEAVRAVDDWAGDAYVSFEREGKVCTAAAFVGDTAEATGRLSGTLDRWAAARPAGAASVTRSGRRVELLACDPGAGAPAGRDATDQVMTLLVNRSVMVTSLLQSGVQLEPAACVANRSIEQLTLEELAASTLLPGVEAKLRAIGVACGASPQ